jgi:hypothetical protein
MNLKSQKQMTKKIRRQASKEKAIDQAIWLTFKHRRKHKNFGVVQSSQGDCLIIEHPHASFSESEFEPLPNDYSQMDYSHIKRIGMDEDPLMHWEEIKGMVSTMHGELLRFILKYNVPLEKFIRLELANRGHDENHVWVGFEKAEEIWLTD